MIDWSEIHPEDRKMADAQIRAGEDPEAAFYAVYWRTRSCFWRVVIAWRAFAVEVRETLRRSK